MAVIARATDASDRDLVSAVRSGDDCAFEELYRRYSRRVAGFVCKMVGDADRAEDVTQEAFFSALRRLRQTDAEIVFKPWIFEIAKNAAIDAFRRTSRAEEVSIYAEDGSLRPADHLRLVGGTAAPETALEGKERLDHLRGAFDELSDSHSRILILRELEGLSYREIGEAMDMSRPAVESTLFRARRRLNEEYAEIDTGARCLAITAAIARLSEGIDSARDRRRVGRHVGRCSSCRRHARELGVNVAIPTRSRVAALLPLPALTRRRRGATHDGGAGMAGTYGSGVERIAGAWAPAVVGTGAAEGTAQAWSKAVAVVAAIALAGGGAAVHERVIAPDRSGPAETAPADGSGGSSGGGSGRDDAFGGGGGGAGAGGGTPSDSRGGSGSSSGQPGARDELPDIPDAVRPPSVGGGGAPPVGAPPVTAPSVAPPGPPDAPGLPGSPEMPQPDPSQLPSTSVDSPDPNGLLHDLGVPALPPAPGVTLPDPPVADPAVNAPLPAVEDLGLPTG